MGKAKDFWREMVPILGRTHPAFRTRVRPAERGPDRDDGDLQSEVQGLREQVRELSDEVVRQRKVLSGVVAKGRRGGSAAYSIGALTGQRRSKTVELA